MKQKSWWKSKTLWFNVVSGLVIAAQGMTSVHWIPGDYLTVIVVSGNFFLRFITDTGIAVSKR